ncbi:MAG: DUF6440 family protein [Alphaproteobacteria bacterium]
MMRDFAKDVAAVAATTLAIFVVVAIELELTISFFGLISHDDSDPPGGGYSSFKVVTDNKTGMQYLKTSLGGITPRLGSDGRQLGLKTP